MNTRIECPSCQQPIEVADETDTLKNSIAAALEDRRSKIRRNANVISGFASLLGGIGALAFVAGIYEKSQGDTPGSSWLFGLIFFGAALALYIAAQIVHIRANTER